MTQPLPAAIATWAMAVAASGWLVVSAASAIRAPAGGAGTPAVRRGRRLVQSLLVGLIAFGVLSSFAVLALIVLSGALIGAGAPKVVYLFTAAVAAFAVWRGIAHSSYGMEGCAKALILSWGAYGLSWSAASLWLIPETAPASWSAGAVVRPLAVAAMPALLACLLSKDSRKLVQGLGLFVCLAALCALVFFPVENGLARKWLPRSDWLRFPLAGAVVAAGLMLIPQVVQLAAARRSASRRKTAWRGVLTSTAFVTIFGALLGLFWAVTRAIEIAI